MTLLKPAPKRFGLILLIVATAVLGAFSARYFVSSPPRTLTVPFPFGVLKPDQTLLDPRNTASTWEYYLLENLSLGLLRDAADDARGYAPGLATAWSQTRPDAWVFAMRPDLRWSDGTPMTLAAIAAYYRELKNEPTRHLLYLKALTDVVADDAENTLTFLFSVPVGRSVLHELSLADAAYLHPTNLTRDWRITSGAYAVDDYRPQDLRLRLRRNDHASLFAGKNPADSPETVALFWTKEADFSAFFRAHGADVFTSGAFSFRGKVAALDDVAAARIQGYPTVVYYWEIDGGTALGQDRAVRRAFAAFMRRAFAAAALPSVMSAETQMIPTGYYGRLEAVPGDEVPADALRGKTLNLALFAQMAELKPLFERLSAAARDAGFTLNATFNPTATGVFARAQVFKGNQKDASGTWSFLFSDPNAHLHGFHAAVAPEMDAMLAATDDADRLRHSLRLHEKALTEAYVVPFAKEFTPVYTSARVDLSRWNPFDMRLRFYDVRWR